MAIPERKNPWKEINNTLKVVAQQNYVTLFCCRIVLHVIICIVYSFYVYKILIIEKKTNSCCEVLSEVFKFLIILLRNI